MEEEREERRWRGESRRRVERADRSSVRGLARLHVNAVARGTIVEKQVHFRSSD